MVSRMKPFLEDQEECFHAYAPNFTIINAQVTGQLVRDVDRPIYVTGKGYNTNEALVRLYGEAAERVSLFSPHANETWEAFDPLTDARQRIKPREVFGDQWHPSSHGCASHNRAELSQIYAIEELLERRAVQDWWEHKGDMHPIDFDDAFKAQLEKQVVWSRRDSQVYRNTVFLSMTDMRFTKVIAAVSHDADFDQIAIAFAAGANTGKVCQRALEELLQVELNTRRLEVTLAKTDQAVLPRDLSEQRDLQKELRSRLSRHLETPEISVHMTLPDPTYTNTLEILNELSRAGSPVLLVDMTHPEIGIPTTRAIFKDAAQNPFVTYCAQDRTPL